MSLFRKERVSFSEKGTRAACVFVDVGFVLLLLYTNMIKKVIQSRFIVFIPIWKSSYYGT